MADYATALLGGSGESPKQEPGTDYASALLDNNKKAETQGGAVTAIKGRTQMRQEKKSDIDYYGSLKDTVADVPSHLGRALRGFWQGATDLPVGLTQLASKFGPDNVEQAVSEYIKEREADYQASRGEYADRADLGRVTGNVTASLPIGGTRAAATLGGRMVQGAKVGAMTGAVTPVDPEADNFALRKASQVAGGAVVGAVAPPLVEGVIKGAGAAVNAVADMMRGAPARLTNKATQDAIESTLTVELQKNGVNFADLSAAARNSLILETQKALKSGGTIDPKAIERLADFQKLGVEGLEGQISRNPSQFALERNLGKTDIGAPIAERLGKQNQRFVAVLDETKAATGGVADDAYDAGKSVMGALKSEDETARKAVKAAYDAAKAKAGAGAEVPMQPIADRLGRVIDEVGAENIPAAVAGRLREFGLLDGKQTKLFTLEEAEKLRKLIGNNMPGQRTPIDAALAPLKQSLDDAVNSLAGKGDLIGAEAATAIGAARDVAKERFKKIDSIPALSDMLKNKQIPPEDFVQTYVIRGSVDEVRSLMGQLPPGARRDVRASVVDWLKSKAVSGDGDTATFSQAGFNKALDSIGKRNLQSIFENSPGILEQLRRLGRVAADVQKAPISSGVNYSSSATAIIDMLDKVGRLPFVSAIAGKPGDIVRAQQVARSLTPPAPVKKALPLLTSEMLDDVGRSGGAVAPAVGAGAFAGFSYP